MSCGCQNLKTCHTVNHTRRLHCALTAARTHALKLYCVGCVMCTDCNLMQPIRVHLLVACPASAVWWPMQHFLFHRPGPLGLCKAPSGHSLFYRQLLQRLLRFQAHMHHPGAVPAHTDCTTIAACPACMLCWYAQYGPYTDA